MDDVLVIGGGAAGMIAAWSAASRAAGSGASVRLLEKNDRLGLKIYISGGGKCNITHGGDMEAVRRAFDPAEARFLHHAFRRFTNEQVLELIRGRGVTVHTRADGRVFPDSGRAEDVVDALEWHVRSVGARLEFRAPVTELITERTEKGDQVIGARAGERFYPAGTVIVAVGGSSYPKTGTTGDGYRWMRGCGHTVVPLRPALAPIYLGEGVRPEYSGVALRDCLLRARAAGREIARWRGDVLYTHHGVSGPGALGISRPVARSLEQGEVSLDVDLLPGRTAEELAEDIAAGHAGAGRRTIRTLVQPWLPERLIPELLERAGIQPSMSLNQLPRKSRNRLVEAVKRWELGPVRAVPLERGEVVAGGIALDEVNPTTMESRKIRGLYLCGEILDIAGPVGGYNLQAAFSTGFVAGEFCYCKRNEFKNATDASE